MISYDLILEKVGEIGLCQIVVALLLSYSDAVSGYHTLVTVFIAYVPSYRCNVPPFDNSTAYPNLTESDILNYTTPYDQPSQEYDTCVKYSYNYGECDGTLSCVNTSANHIPCDQGYSYDRSLFTENVITEFNLICDREYLNPLSTSIYYVGFLVGSLLFGNTADRYGRKPTLVVSSALAIACMFAMSYSVSVEMYMVFRALVAGFNYGHVVATFVYIMENIGTKWRTTIGMIYQIFFSIGFMIVGALAYNWRNWHDLLLVASIFSCPLLIIVIILPESPRWLFAMEKDKEGIRVAKLMARINKKQLTEEDLNEAKEAGEAKMKEAGQENSSKKYSILDLFKTPGLRITSFKVMFSWFVNSLVYYGVSLNAGSLADGVFEIASYLTCMILMDRIGRRILLSAMFTISGLGLVASVIVNEYAGNNESLTTLGVVFALVAKFGIAGAFAIIYNFTAELYPTVLRSNGVGNGSIASRIGGISAPYIISIQNSISWLPNSIFGVFALTAGLLSLTYPETNGKPMIETIEQAEIFYKTGDVVDLNKIGNDKSVTDKDLPLGNVGEDNKGFTEDWDGRGVRF